MNFNQLENIAIWTGLYLIFSTFLYFVGIKNDWQQLRITRGLCLNPNNNPPGMRTKCVFDKPIYKAMCWELFFKSILLSTLIFMGFILVTPVYNIIEPLAMIKTFASLLFIYGVFSGITTENGKETEELLNSKNGIMKQIFSIFVKFKERFLITIINKEETHINKQIDDILNQWYETRTGKQDKIGVFILRLHDFVNESILLDIEESLQGKVYDVIYDISVMYIEDDDAYLMDKLRLLLNKILVNKCNINLVDVAKLIKNQANSKLTKNKIKEKIKKNIENITKKKAKKLTKSEVINSLGTLVISESQIG